MIYLQTLKSTRCNYSLGGPGISGIAQLISEFEFHLQAEPHRNVMVAWLTGVSFLLSIRFYRNSSQMLQKKLIFLKKGIYSYLYPEVHSHVGFVWTGENYVL